MGQKKGISWVLLTLALGAGLICTLPSTLEPAHHPAGPVQGAAGPIAHLGACEDDQPVLTTALQRAEFPWRHEEAFSLSREAHQAQGIGGRGPETAEGLPTFLSGSPPQGKVSEKLYKLYLSFLI